MSGFMNFSHNISALALVRALFYCVTKFKANTLKNNSGKKLR